MAKTGDLDQQFEQLTTQLTLLALSQPRVAKLRIQAWLTKLKEPTNNAVWKRNRNLYGALLLAQLQQGQLHEPFTAVPPDGALPNLPNHLIYRGLSPSRAANHPRSGSTSPVGRPGRSRSPILPPHQPLNKGQLHGLVKTFHNNMQARGFDLSQPRATSRGRSRPPGAVTTKPQGAATGTAPISRTASATDRAAPVAEPVKLKLGRSSSHSGEGALPLGAGAFGRELRASKKSNPASLRESLEAVDDTRADQGDAAALLLAAKEAEIAARVAAKRRQQLEREAAAKAEAAAAAQRKPLDASATKSQLDAMISRYSGAREQWASPGGASGADRYGAADMSGWQGVGAVPPGCRSPSRSPASTGRRSWPSPDPALTYSVVRKMRSSPRALLAAAEEAAAQSAGPAAYDPGGAGVGDGAGFLLPRILAAPPIRPSSTPSKFDFSDMLGPVVPHVSASDVTDFAVADAVTGPENVDMDQFMSDFEGSLMDNLDAAMRSSSGASGWDSPRRSGSLRVDLPSMPSGGSTSSGLSPRAMRLADRFALHSALADFRRAVERLKRRLASDPTLADALYGRGRDGVGAAPLSAQAQQQHIAWSPRTSWDCVS
ncbi:hypothetical protein GPECTOR_28g757 [Gonium pectorale]|uniref:DUF4485 domain-containing protein n=1 Tax=Gonium pectorale TaxID=33097 RepID=A0A150GG86_GONPE|nr:hypothetical protein GPECTOR_28g757 [Gonium pectorale]|eukprot:KXZ48350.1 hypothetical protein GPECTOR_28g757 [Gonium pectorale]